MLAGITGENSSSNFKGELVTTPKTNKKFFYRNLDCVARKKTYLLIFLLSISIVSLKKW